MASSDRMKNSIKSPLIRQLVYTFGFLGYQLTPIQTEQGERRPLVLLHNTAFTALVFYVLVEPSYDPYYVEMNLEEINKHYKPLLGTVVQLNILLFYPLSHLLYKGHFACCGRQIVRLLDDAAATTGILDYNQKPRHWLLIVQAAVLLLLLTTYIFLHCDILQLALDGVGEPPGSNSSISSLTSKCLKVLATFSVYVDIFFTYGIVLLFKLSMRKRLCQMVSQISPLSSNCSRISDQGVRQIGRQLRRIASMYARHNQLLSFPFFVYVFASTVDCVGLICLSRTEATFDDLSLLSYLLLIFLSTMYLAYLDERSLHCFRLVLKQLRTLKVSTFNDVGRRNSCVGRSARIYLEELEFYEQYLPLKLFGLCTVDYMFVICCALLVAETSVMIIQTSHK